MVWENSAREITYSLVKREDEDLHLKWFPVSLYLCSSILNIILAVVLDIKSWHPFYRRYCRPANMAEAPLPVVSSTAGLWSCSSCPLPGHGPGPMRTDTSAWDLNESSFHLPFWHRGSASCWTSVTTGRKKRHNLPWLTNIKHPDRSHVQF